MPSPGFISHVASVAASGNVLSPTSRTVPGDYGEGVGMAGALARPLEPLGCLAWVSRIGDDAGW
jgi:hypothetical protein